ncbi:hypothetical protein BHYA_0186g00240 [Botrytis hyacinthi]|uniref:Cytochrome P450 n=1 Tax=Botrytis hyacinthi TaxID=278943 RepID=A0A4Z1GLG2_9HELO|nr:hypothetical protein BHYA_0186g00240 [Botrytis hyacinthi]
MVLAPRNEKGQFRVFAILDDYVDDLHLENIKNWLDCIKIGRHNCIGKNSSLMQLRSVIATLVTRYDISLGPNEDGLVAVKDIRYRLAARKAGCAMPVKYWHKDPFLGLDLFFWRLKDMNSGDSTATDRIILGKYGKTVLTNNWGTKQYVTMDPIVIQTVLALEVDKFGVAPMNHPMCSPLLGEGIMTVDGHAWKKSRSLLNLVFTRAQVSELSSLEAHVKIFLDLIPRGGTTIDMQPLCKKLFLDISSEFVFGKSANSLSPGKSSTVSHRLVHLFDEALVKMFQRYMLGRFKFLIGEEKWFAQCAEVQGIVDELIDEEFKNKAAAAKGFEVQTDIPYNHVLLKELVKMTDDRRYRRDELMNVFFPARDTAGILWEILSSCLHDIPKYVNHRAK